MTAMGAGPTRTLGIPALIAALLLAVNGCKLPGSDFPGDASDTTTLTAGQVSTAPGSPAATTSVDSTHLPLPPAKFGGVIQPGVAQSKPWWPPQVRPPKGAPNVL